MRWQLLEQVVQNSVYLDGKLKNDEKKDNSQTKIGAAVMEITELYLR